jgi:curved DNA-binding protein CbpA
MSFQIKQGLFKLNLTDHYAILGIPLDADSKQIRQKYLKIAQKLHPDTCQYKDDDKKQANQFLSKLVNPAYEELSKEKTKAEYQLILSQVGKKLAEDSAKITLATETAQKLLQANNNFDLVYRQLLTNLTYEQYSSLDKTLAVIAQISELNLVYLILKQTSLDKSFAQQQPPSNPPVQPHVQNSIPEEAKKESLEEEMSGIQVSSYIRRAQEYFDKNNFVQAIVEIKDALKIDPNNSIAHALMGLCYLKQNQITMAKVHINKAWQLNPQDSIVIKSKQELDKLESQQPKNGNSNNTKGEKAKPANGGGILSGWFTKKK